MEQTWHHGSQILADDFDLVMTAAVFFFFAMLLIQLLATFRHVRHGHIIITGIAEQDGNRFQ